MALKKVKDKAHQLKQILITKSQRKSAISEQYRTLRTNIQFSAVDRELKTIVVTSPSVGEGKTTTVANLAVVFAQQGKKKVLVVDADLRRPSLHHVFEVTNTIGLSNVLARQAKLAGAIHHSFEKNLFVLPSGPVPMNPTELLASKGMDSLLEDAKQEFDLILFDSPSLLAVTDGQIIADKCDGSILTVCSGKTGTEQAVKAKELLTAAKSHIIGVVLNKRKQGKNSYASIM